MNVRTFATVDSISGSSLTISRQPDLRKCWSSPEDRLIVRSYDKYAANAEHAQDLCSKLIAVTVNLYGCVEEIAIDRVGFTAGDSGDISR